MLDCNFLRNKNLRCNCLKIGVQKGSLSMYLVRDCHSDFSMSKRGVKRDIKRRLTFKVDFLKTDIEGIVSVNEEFIVFIMSIKAVTIPT